MTSTPFRVWKEEMDLRSPARPGPITSSYFQWRKGAARERPPVPSSAHDSVGEPAMFSNIRNKYHI